MTANKLSEQWLFETHSKSTVKRWCKALKYGFFKRAWGGHANDGDEFGIWLHFKNKAELLQILGALCIALEEILKNRPKGMPGKKYTSAEFDAFKSEIKEFPEYEQPGHVTINSIPCFCWISQGRIALSFSGQENGDSYDVSEVDYEHCLQVESVITDNTLMEFICLDYQHSANHISRLTYPEWFV